VGDNVDEPRRLNERELYDFDTAGFLVEPEFITVAECSEIASVLEPSWRDPDPQDPVQRIDDVADHPLLADLLEGIVSRSGVYDTINQPFRVIETYALRRGAGSTQPLHNGRSNVNRSARGSSNRAMWREHTYHDGLLYCMMVKALVYLSDVSAPEDGPLAVVEGSHKANYPYPYSRSEMEAGAGLDDPSTRPVYTRAGDLVLLNEASTHGSLAKLSDGYRTILAFSFAPSFVADYAALSEDSTGLFDVGFCE
jgi:Phytanoyl-CoA dioxygenase (PhyH)